MTGPTKLSNQPSDRPALAGMRAFYILWAGQFVSIFATRMTRFAITLWAWDLTGTATGLVLVGVVSYIPNVVLSPFAGALVDRWNRKLTLALSDAGAAASTVVLLYLFATDSAEIWHLYVTGALAGIFGTFQYPAYAAVIPTMVPKDQYARANGMRTMVGSASGIAAPLLAGALLAVVDIATVLILDLATFGLAIITLLIIRIPQPIPSEDPDLIRRGLLAETWQGLRYVLDRRSLVAIFLLFTFSNLNSAFGYPIMAPMILAKTGDDSVVLGMVQSAGSIGFMAGSAVMSFWGGPRRRIHAINIPFVLWGLLGAFVFGPAWSLPFWLFGSFMMAIYNPILNSAYMAILQSKVSPDLQGRVFGLEMTVSTVTFPFGQVVAGLLADRILEPGMEPGGWLTPVLGPIFGTGTGAGMGVTIGIAGVLAVTTGLLGYLIAPIRDIEDRLPDHALAASESESVEVGAAF